MISKVDIQGHLKVGIIGMATAAVCLGMLAAIEHSYVLGACSGISVLGLCVMLIFSGAFDQQCREDLEYMVDERPYCVVVREKRIKGADGGPYPDVHPDLPYIKAYWSFTGERDSCIKMAEEVCRAFNK